MDWDAPGMNRGTFPSFPGKVCPRPHERDRGRWDGAAWGEQDNAGVHFLLQKMAGLIMCSNKIYGILGCTGVFLGFEKKDQLAKLLDVDARCIWMWFALFLNNRQF